MERTEINYVLLACIFVAALTTANILASKILIIGKLEVPASIVAYPFTFLITDIIGEIWGKKHAQNVVYIGIVCQLISLVMIYSAIYLPAAPYQKEFDDEFEQVLGSTARVVTASLLAFMVSQALDVHLFHKLKDRYVQRKWIRNNGSTMCSQAVDSTLFILIAFAGTDFNIPLMIGSHILIKVLIALCDTPLFYYLTSEKRTSGSNV